MTEVGRIGVMSEPTAPVPVPPRAAAPRAARAARARGPRSPVPTVLASLVAGVVGGLGGGLLVQGGLPGQQLPAGAPAQSTPDQGTPDQGTAATSPRPAGDADAAVTSSSTPLPPARPPAADGSITGLSRAVLPSVALVSLGAGGRSGQGSAFVIRGDGYLLTNHHVAAGPAAGGISVQLPGREPMEAEVVGSDAVYDIAVLRVDADGLVALPFADSGAVEVGQTVVAVGAPLGLDSTVTSGIVSALNRPVVAGEAQDRSYINAIQTDAAINPGNSGGPLLDLEGRVVGVNSAIAQLPSGAMGPAGSIGLGFAIPADQAERTATQIIETGRSQHPVMGVNIDLRHTGDGARVLVEREDGVSPVVPGGPADLAGIRPGEIILAVDGTRVTDSQHLLVLLRSHAVGDSVELLVRDDRGQERTVTLTLAGSGGR